MYGCIQFYFSFFVLILKMIPYQALNILSLHTANEGRGVVRFISIVPDLTESSFKMDI